MYACHGTVESAVDWPPLRFLPSLASQHRNAKDCLGLRFVFRCRPVIVCVRSPTPRDLEILSHREVLQHSTVLCGRPLAELHIESQSPWYWEVAQWGRGRVKAGPGCTCLLAEAVSFRFSGIL